MSGCPKSRPRLAAFSRRTAALIIGLAVVVACSDTEGNNFAEPRYAQTSGVLEGYVTDLSTNPAKAVVGARVYTVPVGGVATTGTAGYYKMNEVLAGAYSVHVARDSGVNSSVNASITAGRTTRADVTFNAPALNVGRELFFLTDITTEGQIALINAAGTYQPGQFGIVQTPGLGGRYRSLKTNRRDSNELLVLSNYEHQSDPDNYDVYLLRLSGLMATVTRITSTNVPKDSADFSADGQQIVLSQDADSNGRFELWIMDKTGANARLFVADTEPRTGAQFDHRYPNWSSDGAVVAFSCRRVDSSASYESRDFDVMHAVVSSSTIVPVPGPQVVAPRYPFVPVTQDVACDDVSPSWGELDLVIWYSKACGANMQVYSAPGDDGGSPETQYTKSTYSNYDPTQSFDRKLVAWVSMDDVDGTNSDHSPEITVAAHEGTKLVGARHVTVTPYNPTRLYNSIAWRLR